MSIFAQWIISIAGVVILSAAVEILMPSGSMNKYVRSVLAIVCMLVLISPLAKIKNGEISIGDIFYNQDSQETIDYTFVEYINGKKIELVEEDLENHLFEKGFDRIEIKIEAAYIETQVDITFVKVYLQNLVILYDDKNINSSKEIVKLVCSYLNVIEEKVLLYGE